MSTTYDPTAHTVDEVNAYLTEHPDEAEAVLAAEAGRADDKPVRTGITEGPHATPADDASDGSYDEVIGREETSAFILPSFNTLPQDQQDEQAAQRNAELESAGVNHAQGFIGTDGAANLL